MSDINYDWNYAFIAEPDVYNEAVLILESKNKRDKSSTESDLQQLYFHMLKYMTQQNLQTSSWIKSIDKQFVAVNEFISKHKNFIKILEEKEQEKYEMAIVEVLVSANNKDALASEYARSFTREIPETPPSFFSIKYITSARSMLDFEKQFAVSRGAWKYLEDESSYKSDADILYSPKEMMKKFNHLLKKYKVTGKRNT